MATHKTKTDFTIYVIPLAILGFAAAYCCHGDSRKKWRYSIFHDAAMKRSEERENTMLSNINENDDMIEEKYTL